MKGLLARWWRRGLLALALAALATAAWIAVPYPVERLEPDSRSSLTITDRHGQVLRVVPLGGGGRASWVGLAQISPLVIAATLAGEDHRFYVHPGVDARAVVRAFGLAIGHRRIVSGASTVTMQVVRLVTPHRRGPLGKLGEMRDALRLERAVTKEAILEQYLNRAYYGNGAWGIEAAARRHFGKPAAALSAGEATLLAVLQRWPAGYDLYRHRQAALDRRSHVLDLMQGLGWIDAAGRAQAEADPIVLAQADVESQAPHFVDWVLQGLPAELRARGGVVTTTLDWPLQQRLEAAVRRHAAERGLRQAGLVVVDPGTGAVRAMVGSVDHAGLEAGQVNITTAPRHPGSTLKPFVYAAAVEGGDSPATLARDRLPAEGYHPRHRMRQRGDVRYREALGGSFNLAAVDVLNKVGVAAILERLRQAGLGPLGGTAPEYGLDLALGSARVRLVDLAAAYAFLVEGGVVRRASNLADQPQPPVRLYSPQASFLVMDMLADPEARRAAFGADLPLDLPFRVAAKTGTSSGFSDTLAVGATREAVVAAWAGSFDGSGTRGTLAMWSAAPLVRTALLAVRDQRGQPLTLPDAPDGVVARDVCAVTGDLPGSACPTKHEVFIEGHLPTTACPGHPVRSR